MTAGRDHAGRSDVVSSPSPRPKVTGAKAAARGSSERFWSAGASAAAGSLGSRRSRLTSYSTVSSPCPRMNCMV